MNNIINFPVREIFNREDFDLSQDKSKEIASQWVMDSPTLDAYALTLAMASGHALSFIKNQYPDLWDEIGEALEVVAIGGGLTHE